MKTRKTLVIRFRDAFACTLFLWDGAALGHRVRREADGLTLRVEVQRRTERQEVRRRAYPYGAECRTEVR